MIFENTQLIDEFEFLKFPLFPARLETACRRPLLCRTPSSTESTRVGPWGDPSSFSTNCVRELSTSTMATTPPALSPVRRTQGRRLSSFHTMRTPARRASTTPQDDALDGEPLAPLSSPKQEARAKSRRLSSFHTAEKPARPVSATPRRRDPITPSRPSSAAPRPLHASRASAIAPNAKASTAYTPGRRKPGVPTAPDAAAHSALPPARMSDAALADMYSTTIKLCQEGKINAKNTWSLNLIDYMEMLVKDGKGDGDKREEPAATGQEAGGDTNFQVAGVTLDAGVRIYCSRVDSVHSNAFKVLGALSRTSKPNDSGDLEDADDEGDETQKKRKRSAHRSGGNTLESNIESLTVHKLETDLAVDPLFQKMSAAFDEGGAKGMLLNNLAVGHHSEIIFDSSELVQLSSESETEPKAAPGTNELPTYSVTELLPSTMQDDGSRDTALVLCPRFTKYYHSKMAGREALIDESSSIAESSQSAPALPESEEAGFDFEYSEGDLLGSDVTLGVVASADDHANGNDGGFDDSFEDDDDAGVFNTDNSSISARPSLGGRILMSGAVDLVEAGMLLHRDSEYSFFDSSALSSWAGPQHWRFRAAPATALSRAGSDGDKSIKPGRKPRGKTAMLLDYSSEAPKIDFAAEFARPKSPSSCQLSDAVQDGYTEKKVTLPEDLHFKTQMLATLFLKPKVLAVAKRRRTTDEPKPGPIDTEEESAARGWYDFENDGDNEDFCPQDDENANALFEFDDNRGENSKAEGLDLVPVPTRVEKIDIGFATVAKKVDVRMLKTGMWTQLRAGSKDAADELEGDGVADKPAEGSTEAAATLKTRESSSSADGDDVRAGGVQTLQQVVEKMPSFVPETSLPDVSLSYVFICLLHLANEKTLSIKQADDGSLDNLLISSTHNSPDSAGPSQ